MKKRFLAATVVGLLATNFFTWPTTAAISKNLALPAQYALSKCLSSTEFDCIESVGIVNEQGTYFPGLLAGEKLSETPRTFMGNTIYDGNSTWVADSQEITLRGTIDGLGFVGCNGTCSALRIHVDVARPLTTKVRFVFRTSILRPMNVQMKAAESDYKYEKIPGGVRWTMEGKGLPYSRYQIQNIEELNAKKAANALADLDGTLFDFYIHHAGNSIRDSYWDPICADKGFSVQSHNTDETGDPIWDAQNESLIFSIFAPHFKANGDLNTGYFKYWTTHEFMDCKYPKNTLTKAAKLTIEILNEDGTKSVATSAVTNKDGVMYFFASGFHFSSPRILIKADQSITTAPAPTPSATPTASHIPITPLIAAPKKSTITCVKGKTAKKITAVSPKCPTGYKKR